MNKIISILLIVIVFLGFTVNNSHALPLIGNDNPKNVILISWDGVNRDVMHHLLAQNDLPNLKKLTEHGNIVDLEITDHMTDTVAGHAEMLTGYGPAFTDIYAKETVRQLPEQYTIFERLETHYGHNNIKTIVLSGKGSIMPFFPESILTIDVFDVSDAEAPTIGEKSVNHISELGNERFFIFIHFMEPDSEGHRFGTESFEYYNSILILDQWLGKIMDELKSQGIEDSTTIYITTDHGFDGRGHDFESARIFSPDIFLASNSESLVSDGNQLDIVPTIFAEFGINPCLIPISEFPIPYTGKSLTKYGVPCMSTSIILTIILIAGVFFYIRKSRKKTKSTQILN